MLFILSYCLGGNRHSREFFSTSVHKVSLYRCLYRCPPRRQSHERNAETALLVDALEHSEDENDETEHFESEICDLVEELVVEETEDTDAADEDAGNHPPSNNGEPSVQQVQTSKPLSSVTHEGKTHESSVTHLRLEEHFSKQKNRKGYLQLSMLPLQVRLQSKALHLRSRTYYWRRCSCLWRC